MTTTVEPAGAANGRKPAADDGRVDAADEALARELAERAQAEGLPPGRSAGTCGSWSRPWPGSRVPRRPTPSSPRGRHCSCWSR